MKTDTRQKLIDITFDEIYTHGYQGASLSAILHKAGLNKGSMYYFFKSKKEMALAAIDEKLKGFLSADEAPFVENLLAHLRRFAQGDMGRGCPFANLIQEMSNLDEDFYAKLHEIFLENKAGAKATLDRAVAANELKACDTQKLASMIFMVIEGGFLGAKIARDRAEYLQAVEAVEMLLAPYRL